MKKKIAMFIACFLIVSTLLTMSALAAAVSFSSKYIYGSKWTNIGTGSTKSQGVITGTVTVINDKNDKDVGYSKVKVSASVKNGNQIAGEVIAQKGKVFTISIPNYKNMANINFIMKGNNSSLDAKVSGYYEFK